MSSFFGSALKLQIFGQSHAPAIGMSLDGFPAGFRPDFEELQAFLARRAPGQGGFSTARKEADAPEFLSGLVEGHTCGAPIAAIIRNTDIRSSDYANIAQIPRPSHGDFPAWMKWGNQADYRGGGHFSGRLTAPLCIAGGLCLQFLKARGIKIGAHIAQIGAVSDVPFDPLKPQIPVEGKTLSPAAWKKMLTEMESARMDGDSVGGIIECAVTGLAAGYGEPIFGGLENRLAQILFGIPAVKGLEFGLGFESAKKRGSENNDPYYYDKCGFVRTRTNNAGGIAGGISTGMPILFRVAIKPTPSILKPQESIYFEGGTAPATLEIKGRHDPCIVPRAVPCVEAAAAIAILDAILEGNQWN